MKHNLTKYTRICPKCDGEIEYANKYSLKVAIKNNKKCRKCKKGTLLKPLPKTIWANSSIFR